MRLSAPIHDIRGWLTKVAAGVPVCGRSTGWWSPVEAGCYWYPDKPLAGGLAARIRRTVPTKYVKNFVKNHPFAGASRAIKSVSSICSCLKPPAHGMQSAVASTLS